MGTEDSEYLKRLFEQASALPADEQLAFLEDACGDNTEAQAELASLLAAAEEADPFFDSLADAVLSLSPWDEAPAGDESASDPLIGRSLRQYRIEETLGGGGMGVVYRAHDTQLDRSVALKTIRPDVTSDEIRQRFQREIGITAQLQHPHILPLLDSGVAGETLYYVMPYVEGESLGDRLKRDSMLSEREVVQIGRHVAAALDYAHQHDVIHRDIKPGNILLTGDQAVVADFGISKAVGESAGATLTRSGALVGTPAYMPPEQYGGEATGRSDIYALGAVLYEALTGRRWLLGTAVNEADWSGVDPVMRSALAGALELSPEDRWEDAGAFAEALTETALRASKLRPAGAGAGAARARRRRIAGAVGLGVVAAGGWWLATMAGGPAIERLAVLPFTNLMNDPEQEWFVQGTFDALISELGQSGVTVIARTSVMRYRNTDQPIRDIARELDVDAVIEGSVFVAGDSVGIQVRLVDGGTETQLWSQSYDADVRNVLAVYRDVTRAIADEIGLALTPQVEARLASAGPVNPEAYEALLRGQFYTYRLTPHDLQTALDYFQRALEIDPDYALAYTGIGVVWAGRLQMGFVPHAEAYPKAKAAAATALALDSTLAEAHHLLALVRAYYEWDWEGAEAAFRQAIALNPNYPPSRVFYSHFLNFMRRPEEARAQIERALELDPFHFFYQYVYAVHMLFARRYDDAIVQISKVLRTAPNFHMAQHGLWGALHQKGMYEEAMVQAQKYFDVVGDREVMEAMDRGYAEGGYLEAVRRAADTQAARSRTTFVSPLDIAELYANAGEVDMALEWLERGFEDRDPNMTLLSVASTWDGLQDTPRFQDLLRRMNLPGSE